MNGTPSRVPFRLPCTLAAPQTRKYDETHPSCPLYPVAFRNPPHRPHAISPGWPATTPSSRSTAPSPPTSKPPSPPSSASPPTEPEAFLLESVEGGEHVGRYTFIGIEPYKKHHLPRHRRSPSQKAASAAPSTATSSPSSSSALSGHTPARLPGLPPFTAGAVGFFAYDVVRQIETPPLHSPQTNSASPTPASCSSTRSSPSTTSRKRSTSSSPPTSPATRRRTRSKPPTTDAVKRLEPPRKAPRPRPPQAPSQAKPHGKLKLTPRTSKAAFLRAVAKTKEYIASGDVFQCVLSQRFDCTPGVDAFDIYRSLRIVNPSPYMYFLRFGMEAAKPVPQHRGKKSPTKTRLRIAHIVGSSPELLVRVHDRAVEYRPIAGTRPRCADEAEDRALEADLRADEKEVAEHIMLVDLGRNDVGRVSEFGSVKVKDLMFVERYSHVMHLVSAHRRHASSPTSPPSTPSAPASPPAPSPAPPRSAPWRSSKSSNPPAAASTAAAIFYADFSGNLDSCIAIRTLFMNGDKATSRPAPASSPTPSPKTNSTSAATKPAPSSAPSNAPANESPSHRTSPQLAVVSSYFQFLPLFVFVVILSAAKDPDTADIATTAGTLLLNVFRQ